MNVFLTGCESFIGKVLRQMLADAGHEVKGIDLAKPLTWEEGYYCDIRSEMLDSYIRPESVVIHLAAVSTDAACKANPLEALDVNVAGTINVAKAAKARNCRQFIFASTEWVYGERYSHIEQSLLRHEESIPEPHGVYATSKLMGERILQMSGLPNITILRFGITYGPRDKNWCAVESIADKVLRGEDVTVGSLNTARRFVHVRDLCRGIMASIGRTGHETFNLAGERLITLKEVIREAVESSEKPCVHDETSPDSPSIRNPDSTKAKTVLGWTPQIAFADGMREVVEYLRGRMATGTVHYAPYGPSAGGDFLCGSRDGGYTGNPAMVTCDGCKKSSPGIWG